MATCDVLILGAGVAGCAAAIEAARQGLRVVVLEPPGGSASLGESLDWETPRLLRALGVEPEELVARDLATRKLGAVSSHAVTGERLEIGFALRYRALMALVGRSRQTYHIDRAALGGALGERARELGVQWVDAGARRVEVSQGRILRVLDDRGDEHMASWYVGATGRARVLGRAVGASYVPVGPRKVAISTTVPHPYDGRGTRIRLDDVGEPGWIWDIHTGKERTNVGAVFVASEVRAARRQGRSVEALFRDACARHEDLRWIEEHRLDGLEVCSFQVDGVERATGENWVLVGEEASVVEPILSSGVTFALRSGGSAGRGAARLVRKSQRDELDRSMRVALSHTRTANQMLDDLWYRTRSRRRWGLALNVLMILTLNFNLNHLVARRWARTRFGGRALEWAHAWLRWGTGKLPGASPVEVS